MANLFGAGLGVWLVGLVSQWLVPAYGAYSVRYALVFCIPLSCILAALCYLFAALVPKEDSRSGELETIRGADLALDRNAN